MKKLLSVLLVLIMLFAACAWAEGADLTGEWYLVEATMGGISINPAMLGMDMFLVLNADGTASMGQTLGEESETAEGTWARTETGIEITAGETTTPFVLDGDQLKMEIDEENAMVFGREKPVAAALPAPVAAESEDAFLGTWTASQASMLGMTVPAEAAGMAMTLTVEPGKAFMDTDGEIEEMATAFTDGALIMTETVMGEIKAQLTEDGGLCMEVLLSEGSLMSIYFVKAE